MDVTPPRAFADDDDVGGYGKTPEPHRRRVEELERRGELLCREKGSLVRKLDAETKRFDTSLKAKMGEYEDIRMMLGKTQRELERVKNEAESMREELDLFAVVAGHKALLSLAQEQLIVVELEHRLVQAEQQRVIRDHKIAIAQSREAELLAEAEERNERISELEASLRQADSSAKASLASSSRSAATDLSKALDENARLVARVGELEGIAAELKAKEKDLNKATQEKTKLATQVEKLEASVDMWKGKEKEVRVQLDAAMSGEKDKEGSSEKEIRTLKAQLRSANADLETKESDCVDLQEELASLKEKSKEREKELKAKLKAVTEQSEQAAVLQKEIAEKKASAKASLVGKERSRSSASAVPEEAISRKKVVSPVKVSKPVKERSRKATTVEPESDVETATKKTKRTLAPESPPKTIKIPTTIALDSDDENSGSIPPLAKIRKAPRGSEFTIKAPLGESSVLNRLVKSSTMSALSKRKSPASDKAPLIMITPADEDQVPTLDQEFPEKGAVAGGEKKKKRKLLGTKAAFKWDPILESGSGVIPSTFSPMKPGTVGTIPRSGFGHSASARNLSRI